jgi:tyrosyl-tRNA synthetase
MLKEMIFNRRHLHLSIYFLVQTWYSVPKDIRKLFNNAFIFKVSKNEMENIFEEVVEQKKELIPAISKIVFSEPYQFLFINIESQRMFKNWDELVIDGDDK